MNIVVRDWPDPRFPDRPLTRLEVALAGIVALLRPLGTISLIRHLVATLGRLFD